MAGRHTDTDIALLDLFERAPTSVLNDRPEHAVGVHDFVGHEGIQQCDRRAQKQKLSANRPTAHRRSMATGHPRCCGCSSGEAVSTSVRQRRTKARASSSAITCNSLSANAVVSGVRSNGSPATAVFGSGGRFLRC
jgi:hypothetical protein